MDVFSTFNLQYLHRPPNAHFARWWQQTPARSHDSKRKKHARFAHIEQPKTSTGKHCSTAKQKEQNKQLGWWTNSWPGAATGTAKDPFLVSVDQNLVTWVHQWWQSCIRRTIMHQETKKLIQNDVLRFKTFQNGANISFWCAAFGGASEFFSQPP